MDFFCRWIRHVCRHFSGFDLFAFCVSFVVVGNMNRILKRNVFIAVASDFSKRYESTPIHFAASHFDDWILKTCFNRGSLKSCHCHLPYSHKAHQMDPAILGSIAGRTQCGIYDV